MGVYNPKATMPRSCFDCGCNDGFTCEYLETDCYIADYAQTERIHPDCPLVEVKAPHGRLIDADALEKVIGRHPLNWEYGQGVEDCFDDLINAPTIIEAEG